MRMLYGYDEMLARYGSAYQIGRAVDACTVYKVAHGLYSDERHPDLNAVVCALYPQAALTMDSAFYLHGLTDEVPDDDDDADDKEETSPKKMLKILNWSHKFLKRTGERLAWDIKAANKKAPALPAGKKA